MIITVISELWRQTLYGLYSVLPDSEGNGKETRQWTLDSTEPNYTEHQLIQQFTSAQYVLRFCTIWVFLYPGIAHVFVSFSSSLFSANTKIPPTDDLHSLPLHQTSLHTLSSYMHHQQQCLQNCTNFHVHTVHLNNYHTFSTNWCTIWWS